MFFVEFFSAFLNPQTWINGLLLGGIYALLGVGMTMIFGIVKLTNLAHGEFVILALTALPCCPAGSAWIPS